MKLQENWRRTENDAAWPELMRVSGCRLDLGLRGFHREIPLKPSQVNQGEEQESNCARKRAQWPLPGARREEDPGEGRTSTSFAEMFLGLGDGLGLDVAYQLHGVFGSGGQAESRIFLCE